MSSTAMMRGKGALNSTQDGLGERHDVLVALHSPFALSHQFLSPLQAFPLQQERL